MKVKIYTTPTCGFCIAAKRLLNDQSIPFEEIDLSDSSERAQVQAQYDWPTVPLVFIEDELIGGFTDLEAYGRRNGLEHLR